MGLFVTHYFVTIKEDDNQLNSILKLCNGFVTCSGSIEEKLYIDFIHSGIATLGLYPEELVPENLYFKWPSRTKMQHMYHNLLKEGNGDHNYLRCPDL